MKYFKTVIKFPHENVVSYNTFALKRMPYVFLHWQGWQMHRLCDKYWHVETLSLNPQADMNMGDTVSCTYIHIPGWQTEMQVKKKKKRRNLWYSGLVPIPYFPFRAQDHHFTSCPLCSVSVSFRGSREPAIISVPFHFPLVYLLPKTSLLSVFQRAS